MAPGGGLVASSFPVDSVDSNKAYVIEFLEDIQYFNVSDVNRSVAVAFDQYEGNAVYFGATVAMDQMKLFGLSQFAANGLRARFYFKFQEDKVLFNNNLKINVDLPSVVQVGNVTFMNASLQVALPPVDSDSETMSNLTAVVAGPTGLPTSDNSSKLEVSHFKVLPLAHS